MTFEEIWKKLPETVNLLTGEVFELTMTRCAIGYTNDNNKFVEGLFVPFDGTLSKNHLIDLFEKIIAFYRSVIYVNWVKNDVEVRGGMS